MIIKSTKIFLIFHYELDAKCLTRAVSWEVEELGVRNPQNKKYLASFCVDYFTNYVNMAIFIFILKIKQSVKKELESAFITEHPVPHVWAHIILYLNIKKYIIVK